MGLSFQCLSDNRAVGRAQPSRLPSTKTLLSQTLLPHLQGQSSPEVGTFHYFLRRAPPCQESQLSLSPRQVHAKFWDSPVPLAQYFLHQGDVTWEILPTPISLDFKAFIN